MFTLTRKSQQHFFEAVKKKKSEQELNSSREFPRNNKTFKVYVHTIHTFYCL